MTAPLRKQRGAVTLMGALVIIITLVLMIEVLHRMAGTDILDTSLQNDSVEALFIAETGIEHASYRYANGVACAALVGGPVNSGRGSFEITGAGLIGTDCRIRLTGTVSSTGATAPANRTIDADLRLAGNGGWIVGDGGTILSWDGAAWNAVASGTAEDLNGIHCVSGNDCWAVGDNGVIRHWDGNNWTGFNSGTGVDLQAISCEPSNPNYCVAVGSFFFLDIITVWNGVSWNALVADLFRGFNNVSCPSNNCYIVTNSGRINRFDGVAVANDNSGTNVAMNGIDCTSDTECWAVGDITGNNWNFDRRNAAGWTPATAAPGQQANQNLNAVSCVDINDCWAVGNRDAGRYVFARWDGGNWNTVTLQNGQQRENLNGVHCIATDDCWAVGDFRNGGNVVRFDGAAWAYVGAAVGNNIDLNDVYMLGGGVGGGGAVALVRWQEFISN